MFKKLLNVGKGHSNAEKLQQLQQQQQKNRFQLNEISSYGFSHNQCLGYSSSLSLLAIGSKTGLLRVFGQPTVEFNYQLEPPACIRQIEFIDFQGNIEQNNKKENKNKQDQQPQQPSNVPAKLVALTDNGQLHLFELKTVKTLNITDNTTQTDASNSCCHDANNSKVTQTAQDNDLCKAVEYTKLDYLGKLDYFTYKLDKEDRSKRVTTFGIHHDGQIVLVGTEGGNLYKIPLNSFTPISQLEQKKDDPYSSSVKRETGIRPIIEETTTTTTGKGIDKDNIREQENVTKTKYVDEQEVNLNDEPQIDQNDEVELFEMIKYDPDIADQIGDAIKTKKQGAIESVRRHPTSNEKILLSYHRGLSIIYNLTSKKVENYFNHNQLLESSYFEDGDFFYTSHNDGSYVRWDIRQGNQAKTDDEYVYSPYPCKPAPKIQACTALVNDQLEDYVIFSGGMQRAAHDDKNPITIISTPIRSNPKCKDSVKYVLDLTSKILDFTVITRPRGQLGVGAKSSYGGGGKKNKNKQQQQQQRNQPIAVALAILAEEEFVVVDLLNSESFLEFPLPYLNCIQPSAITCNQHYSNISNELYEQLLSFSKQQAKGKLSQNEWPITGGKVINVPHVRSHDILLTGHEDGSVNIWDVSDMAMRHLLHVPTSKFFSSEDEDLVPIGGPSISDIKNNSKSENQTEDKENWPPVRRIGRFDPYSDDTRLAIRKINLCPRSGTLLVAGTGGQVLVFELKDKQTELEKPFADEVTIVSDQRFTWKGRDKLNIRPVEHKQEAGYQLSACVQLNPPAAATSTDLRSDWHLFAVGTSYGFVLYDYSDKHVVVNRCTLNMQDFAIVSGDASATAISRKKSFRKSLRESFRRLRRGRSQLQQQQQTNGLPSSTAAPTASSDGSQPAVSKPAFSRGATTGARALGSPPLSSTSLADTAAQAAAAHRNLCSGERQVEFKNELSSIVKCITLTSAIITSDLTYFKPSLWVGTNSGSVFVYAIDFASELQQQQQQQQQQAKSSESSEQATSTSEEEPTTSGSSVQQKTIARLTKEIQLKHKAPIIAIFTSPEAPTTESPIEQSSDSVKSTPVKNASELFSSSNSAAVAANKAEPEANEIVDGQQIQQRAQTPTKQVDKSPASNKSKQDNQARVLICSEEQFKVFNLPSMKPFCKFKLTAHEGLRAKKISITQFMKPISLDQQNRLSFATQTSRPVTPVAAADSSNNKESGRQANGTQSKQQGESNNNSVSAQNNNKPTSVSSVKQQQQQQQQDKELMNAKFGAGTNVVSSPSADKLSAIEQQQQQESGGLDSTLEPFLVCMSNQGDCAIYSVPDLKKQAQIQVCKREDVNGIMSAMLTNYGEGYYLRSSSNFLRFSISSQRVPRVLSVI